MASINENVTESFGSLAELKARDYAQFSLNSSLLENKEVAGY
jgi:hypothetical protein